MSKVKKDRTNRGDLSQYGIFEMSGTVENNLGDDDSDLEAELLALSGGGSKPKPPQRPKAVPTANLDAMVALSLKDIPSDEELSDDDDPDLLNELSEMQGEDVAPQPVATPVKSSSNTSAVLQERLKMYETAEKNAKESGESGRARRFGRGIKTLKDLIKQANAGRSIKEDDIPPVVAVTVHKPASVDVPEVTTPDHQPEPLQPTRIAPIVPTPSVKSEPSFEEPSTSTVNSELLQLLNSRKDEYKAAALKAKRSGDSVSAINFVKVAKQFEMVIKAVESGQEVDVSNMPGPPVLETPSPIQSEVQSHSEEPSEPLPEPTLITASSIAEALQQRLEVYQKQEEKAKGEGNASKARRMGRIVKQFEDAIKRNNAGKPIALEDLPTPPGYAPFPGTSSTPSASTSAATSSVTTPSEPQSSKPATPPAPPSRPNRGSSALSRIDKQVALLVARQKEFKEAALNAKRKGELTQAKEFLRTSKGFDPLINAARGGLPVDIGSLPIPPAAKSQLEEEYDIALAEEATEVDPEHLDILSRLEQQLTKQLKMCLTTSDHNKAIGDIAGKNRFERLALSVTKDLDIIRLAKRSATCAPKFHYEKKDFSIVKSFTDLSDNDLELCILRGINYTCSNPKDVDTYVRFEFPYPQETPVINKTAIVKNTNNPEYNETFTLPIQRNARQCQRAFKRHGIKFEVFSKGGFFRSDSLIGSVPVKLQPLETQCELHDSFDLLEGRKKVGGKLEIRLRLRDPLLTRQVEQLSEKWLVLDH